MVLPLFANMPIEAQMTIFEKVDKKRKIIVSTNLAEASVTIDNIAFVVDSMHVKIKYQDPIKSKLIIL